MPLCIFGTGEYPISHTGKPCEGISNSNPFIRSLAADEESAQVESWHCMLIVVG